MLLGKFSRQRDHKLRIPLPPEILSELGRNIVVTQGEGHCLLIFSLWEFMKANASVLKGSLDDVVSRSHRREITSVAFQIRIDKQRRITLPLSLARYASLHQKGQQQVVLLGIGPILEVWNPIILRGVEKRAIVSEAEAIIKKI